MNKYIFIAGMQKCGTTALAQWLVEQGFAKYLCSGVKEPYFYAPYNSAIYSPDAGGVYLDASVGYANSMAAIEKMPHYNCKIIICVRNQLERSWSSFKMVNILAKGGEQTKKIAEQYPYLQRSRDVNGIDSVLEIINFFFPRKSSAFVEKYFREEVERLTNSSFLERVNYEIEFFLSRREFPLLSVISDSFYYKPIKNLLQKYQPEDLVVLTLDKLQVDENRSLFLDSFLNSKKSAPAIGKIFSLSDDATDKERPDFNSSDFSMLKSIFKYDLHEFLKISENTALGHALINKDELRLHLESQ